jgi:putative zinc finger/helix-turn-helix YgiT family protein
MNHPKPRKKDPHVCLRCGSRDVVVEHREEVVDFKGLTLEVEGLAETRCKACDYRWTTDGQEKDNLAILREAYARKRDEVRDREGLLTGQQIEFVLQQLELSKAQAAELFGGGPHAFTKYVNGEVLQSFAMDRLLRLALAFGRQAVALLHLGRNAPLTLNAGFAFSGASTSTTKVFTLPTGEMEPQRWQVPILAGTLALADDAPVTCSEPGVPVNYDLVEATPTAPAKPLRFLN